MRQAEAKQKGKPGGFPFLTGAGDEARTRDLNLGKVALYQLSYSRIDSGGAKRSRTALGGFAIRCITALLSRRWVQREKGKLELPFFDVWSGKRGSNSRPQPWQGCALPTELFPRFCEGPHYKPSVYPRSTGAYSRTDA